MKKSFCAMLGVLIFCTGILSAQAVTPKLTFKAKDINNKNGNIVGYVYTGSRSFEAWKQIIDEMLQN